MTKIYLCPSHKRLLCSWEGLATDIKCHFENEHSNLLYHNNKLDFDLQLESDHKLMIIDENIFLVQSEIKSKLLILKLRYLGTSQEASQKFYDVLITIGDKSYSITNNRKVIYTGNEGWYINLDELEYYHKNLENILCEITVKSYKNSEENYENVIQNVATPDKTTTEVDSSKLEHLLNEIDDDDLEAKYLAAIRMIDNKISDLNKQEDNDFMDRVSQLNWAMLEEPQSERKISRQDSSQDRFDLSEVQSYIEEVHLCYNCKKDMLPPIYICAQGHNVCVSCKRSFCKCGSIVTSSRNTEEENYSRTHEHPCRYFLNGCMEKFYYTDLKSHEIKCRYCKYKCVNQCGVEEKFIPFENHLKIQHSSIQRTHEFTNCVFNLDSEFFIVSREKGIFYCNCVMQDGVYKWTVIFCGPKDRRFFCELSFKGAKSIEPLFFKNRDDIYYELSKTKLELKKMKVKEKNALLTITSFD